MKKWLLLACLLALTACGGGHQVVEEVSNPYAEHMRQLSKSGILAMQRERWDIAERSFDRALKAAKLANDRLLIAQAWYNLGIMYSANEAYAKAEQALHEADREATEVGAEVMVMRTRLALALAHQKQGKESWRPELVSSNMPLDIQLSAARLVQLQGNTIFATELYHRVVGSRASDRQSVIYQGEAHLGLALLADTSGDAAGVLTQTARVQEVARKAGVPRLAAHAYLLQADYLSEAQKRNCFRKAADIYRELNDITGFKKALQGMLSLAKADGDEEQVEILSGQLQKLDGQ